MLFYAQIISLRSFVSYWVSPFGPNKGDGSSTGTFQKRVVESTHSLYFVPTQKDRIRVLESFLTS